MRESERATVLLLFDPSSTGGAEVNASVKAL
jgi:hypothetical protein